MPRWPCGNMSDWNLPAVMPAIGPVPLVIASTVASCMMTGTESEVKCTSDSTHFEPAAKLALKALMLFSAGPPEVALPRCAIPVGQGAVAASADSTLPTATTRAAIRIRPDRPVHERRGFMAGPTPRSRTTYEKGGTIYVSSRWWRADVLRGTRLQRLL